MYQQNNPEAPRSGYGYNQPPYNQPPYYNPQYATAPVITTKEWLITMLIMLIPIVNIVMVFIYAFGGNENPSKANYFKAALIMAAIGIGIWLVIVIFSVLLVGSALSSL